MVFTSNLFEEPMKILPIFINFQKIILTTMKKVFGRVYIRSSPDGSELLCFLTQCAHGGMCVCVGVKVSLKLWDVKDLLFSESKPIQLKYHYFNAQIQRSFLTGKQCWFFPSLVPIINESTLLMLRANI